MKIKYVFENLSMLQLRFEKTKYTKSIVIRVTIVIITRITYDVIVFFFCEQHTPMF